MAFFWTLEMGICVVAINLPSVWLLLTSMLPDDVLKGVVYEEIDED